MEEEGVLEAEDGVEVTVSPPISKIFSELHQTLLLSSLEIHAVLFSGSSV